MVHDTAHGRHRRYFLRDIPLEEALRRWFGALDDARALAPTGPEPAALDAADIVGRITAAPVWAVASSPHYDAAAMDGIAVHAADTVGATETAPVTLSVGAQAVWVDTGDAMPPGANAVVMIEHVQREAGDASIVRVLEAVAPWQHVRPLGEDIVATELVLPENHRISPVDLGACAAAGLTSIPVRRRPSVSIIPTGNELVPIHATRRPGDIPEFNSLILGGLVRQWGGEPKVIEPVRDDAEAIRAAAAAELVASDVVVINAGSSAGDADYTAAVIESLGTLQVHGIAIRPGHPVALGVARSSSGGKAILGLPGYPVSAALTAELLLKPALERLLGVEMPQRPRLTAQITRKALSPIGEDEFLRVKLGRVGGRMTATPVQRGAGVVMSLVRADGIVRIPSRSEGLDAGATIDVDLLREPEEVENTIVAIGSHDLTLDLMHSQLRRQRPTMSLASAHVGSLGGLAALRRGETHLAGCHLLDAGTGEYNVADVRRYLPDTPVVIVRLVGRTQGLMVAPGNPLDITALDDLRRSDVRFVNRQRGSGTRVLLDYHLGQLGIEPASVPGYGREEYSHLAVAAAVSGGSANVGLGILSAARALGLDFVPLFDEEYDLVIPQEHYGSRLLQPLLALLGDAEFRAAVDALGGYDVTRMGEVRLRLP